MKDRQPILSAPENVPAPIATATNDPVPASRFDIATPDWDETEQRILDAAADLIRTRGVHGLTVAALARAAGVSRPTVYRRWAGAEEIVGATLLRRVHLLLAAFPDEASTRAQIVDDGLRFAEAFRADELFGALLEGSPEIFTRYSLHRVGTSQRMLLAWLSGAITRAQRHGDVRAGDPGDLAVMQLLIAQSAILSHAAVAALLPEEAWREELRRALDGHLRP